MDADKPWHTRWQTLAGALILSCIGILVSFYFHLSSFFYSEFYFPSLTEH
jgi:hypothetical protein